MVPLLRERLLLADGRRDAAEDSRARGLPAAARALYRALPLEPRDLGDLETRIILLG